MKILRVLNNNVVLSRAADGTEVILAGLGIGFKAKPGQEVDMAKVSRTFVPESNRDTDHLGAQVAAIPPEYIAVADDALREVAASLSISPGTATVIALADHLHMATRRADLGHHPLTVEVTHLYPHEYVAARQIIASVNQTLGLRLSDSETVAVALHLVNAGFMTGDLSSTYTMTGVFSQLFDVISAAYDIEVNRDSVSAARFITHMRYFFVRAVNGHQLVEGMSVLWDSLNTSHPDAISCAQRLGTVLELRLGVEITRDELAYLALHVSRLVAET